MSMQNSGKLVSNSESNKPQNEIANLAVRTLPVQPEAPEDPDMNAVYLKAYEGKVDDLIKLLAKVAGSKDGEKLIKHLPGFEGKNAVKDLQKHPETFIKSFLKNDDDLESLLDTIQDSKLGDKLIALLERTPAGHNLFKEIADKIESELTEYNDAMTQYDEDLTAYEAELEQFINPAFLPAVDESVADEIIAAAEAEVSVEDAAAAAAQTEEEPLVAEDEVVVDEEIITEDEVISDEEVVVDEEVLVDGEVAIEEEVISEEEVVDESITPPVSGS